MGKKKSRKNKCKRGWTDKEKGIVPEPEPAEEEVIVRPPYWRSPKFLTYAFVGIAALPILGAATGNGMPKVAEPTPMHEKIATVNDLGIKLEGVSAADVYTTAEIGARISPVYRCGVVVGYTRMPLSKKPSRKAVAGGIREMDSNIDGKITRQEHDTESRRIAKMYQNHNRMVQSARFR